MTKINTLNDVVSIPNYNLDNNIYYDNTLTGTISTPDAWYTIDTTLNGLYTTWHNYDDVTGQLKQSIYNIATPEQMLNSIDIKEIEQYLRKKKIENINKKI